MGRSFPFSLRGREGSVAVEYGPNEDPERWGYGILTLPWPQQLAVGLPVIQATVFYPGEGYSAVMGWIQVVRIHVSHSSESLVSGGEKAPPGDHTWVDGPPHLQGLGVPFVSFGSRPTLFDAPASTESDVRFVADSFLTASPDSLISRQSGPCFGLRWGYSTQAGDDAMLLPLTPLDVDHWQEALPILEGHFPEWVFDSPWFE
jgi:hypothetical protein